MKTIKTGILAGDFDTVRIVRKADGVNVLMGVNAFGVVFERDGAFVAFHGPADHAPELATELGSFPRLLDAVKAVRDVEYPWRKRI